MILQFGDRRPFLEGDEHFVADNATIIGNVRLLAGASVWFNAVLRGDNDLIQVGRGSNIQDGAVLHTDPGIHLLIGDNVTVGHLAMLHGCSIGDDALIGIGSIILNGASIGSRSIVGARSLITENKNFPDGVLLMGAPAKVVRDLTGEEMALIKLSAASYVEKSRLYARQFAADRALLD